MRRRGRLESEKAEILAAMQSPGYYDQDRALVANATERLAEVEAELEPAYERWEALEALAE